MEYLFLFLLMQKLWKSIKKCKTYSRKATGLFFPDTVYLVCDTVNTNQNSKTMWYIYLEFWHSNERTVWVIRDCSVLYSVCVINTVLPQSLSPPSRGFTVVFPLFPSTCSLCTASTRWRSEEWNVLMARNRPNGLLCYDSCPSNPDQIT